MTDRYCVFGNPIGHSKSPVIHAAFARQTGEDISYAATLAPLEGFRESVMEFVAAGGRGANVTLPFKEEAYRLVDEVSARAALAGAVNTLIVTRNGIRGDNTDGVGIMRDITENLGCPVSGRRVLLLGAGGAARGVIGPLLDAEPQVLAVATRTKEKAVSLGRSFGALGPILGASYPELAGESFDIVINATSASIDGELPPLPDGIYRPGSLAYELMYGHLDTPFLDHARQHGAEFAVDGWGMLVEQAAESFFLWRGVRPDCSDLLEKVGDGAVCSITA
ncbi:shikimate dehydrogenase [Propionivibrio limicola]|uniref:shikimate dehydrogenase n=1 Tax=Propionivibrio limicola TaxID=167645 RepID=UPI0012911BB5|nr:shikimate dehydrogenase [Propionivibrio limicola]